MPLHALRPPLVRTALAVVVAAGLAAGLAACGGAREAGGDDPPDPPPDAAPVLTALTPARDAIAAHLVVRLGGEARTAAPPPYAAPADALVGAARVHPPVLRVDAAGAGVVAASVPGGVRPEARVVVAAYGPAASAGLAAGARALADAIRSGDLAFPDRTLAFVLAADGAALLAHLGRGPAPEALFVLCDACLAAAGTSGAGTSAAGTSASASEEVPPDASPLLAVLAADLAGRTAPVRPHAQTALPFAAPTLVAPTLVIGADDVPVASVLAAAYGLGRPSPALLEQSLDLLMRMAARERPAAAGAERAARCAWYERGAAAVLDAALPEQRPALAPAVLRARASLRAACAAPPPSGGEPPRPRPGAQAPGSGTPPER